MKTGCVSGGKEAATIVSRSPLMIKALANFPTGTSPRIVCHCFWSKQDDTTNPRGRDCGEKRGRLAHPRVICIKKKGRLVSLQQDICHPTSSIRLMQAQ